MTIKLMAPLKCSFNTALVVGLLCAGTWAEAQQSAIDPGLMLVLSQQAGQLSDSTFIAQHPGVLSTVQGLNSAVPPAVLQAAQKLLAPSKHYVVQNLTGGEDNPDAAAMEKLTTIVFISKSMPEASLQALFAQGSGRPDVAFVVRGWTPPKFREEIAQFKKQMPKGRPEANVFIDPEAFEKYHVQAVPVTIHKRESDKHWYELTGEISVDGAIAQIDQGHAGRVVGNTYAIAEPDILAVIRNKMARVDWQKQIDHAKASAQQAPFNGVEMPVSTKSESRLFDPSVVMTHDVINPANGQMLAPRGTRVNPLDLQPFPYTVIAFDPYDAAQMKWAVGITKSNPNTLVYVTRNAMHADGRPTWDVLGTRTFALDEQAVSRFDIQSVPTLVQQEGNRMRVTTFAQSTLGKGQ